MECFKKHNLRNSIMGSQLCSVVFMYDLVSFYWVEMVKFLLYRVVTENLWNNMYEALVEFQVSKLIVHVSSLL